MKFGPRRKVVGAMLLCATAICVAWLIWLVVDGEDDGASRGVQVAETLRSPVAWVINDMAYVSGPRALVVVAYAGSPDFDKGGRLYATVRRGRSGWKRLIDDRKLACRAPFLEVLAPVARTATTLAFIEGCVSGSSPKRIRSFSFKDGSVETLVPYSLPFPAGAYAFKPGARRGIVNDGTGLFEELRWIQPDRLSAPIALGLDRVGDPVWSPDGTTIAVSAVTGIHNVEGPMRSVASDWFVRLSNASLRRSVRRVPDLRFDERPHLAWSDDSQVLAASGQVSDEQGALVLVRRSDLASIVVGRGRFGAVAWIDQDKLALVRHRTYEGLGGDYVQVIDVSAALSALRQ